MPSAGSGCFLCDRCVLLPRRLQRVQPPDELVEHVLGALHQLREVVEGLLALQHRQIDGDLDVDPARIGAICSSIEFSRSCSTARAPPTPP